MKERKKNSKKKERQKEKNERQNKCSNKMKKQKSFHVIRENKSGKRKKKLVGHEKELQKRKWDKKGGIENR